MIWTKITIETTTEAEDMISYTLGELGVEGIEVEDKVPLSEADKKAMYIDILPELPPDDGIALISCYIDNPETDVNALVKNIEQELQGMRSYMDIGSGKITISETQDKDWINNWKEFFHPFWLNQILIKPTWIPEAEVARKPGDIMIEIDPGTAFGTGSHETTKLCIEQLEKHLTETKTVFDIGCGSGILSIIAAKLGAKQVFGVDIDKLAVEASWENCEVNHIHRSKAAFMQGDIIGDEDFVSNMAQAEGSLPRYDIVVANILADVIIPLSAKVAPYMNPGGIFISSGIIHTKEEAVRQALLDNDFEIIETTYMKDWVSFTARQKV